MNEERVPSTSEVVSSLRAMGKLFKHLRYANETAELILNEDKIVASLKREAEGLLKEKEVLNKECDAVVVKTTAAEKDLVEAIKKAKSVTQEAIKDIKGLKAVQDDAGKALIDEAKKEADEIDKKTEEAIKACNEAIAAKDLAEADLERIVKQVKDAKDSFMSAFG